MKRILSLISVLIIVFVIYFIATNYTSTVEFAIYGKHFSMMLHSFTVIVFIAGLISGLSYLGGICLVQKDKIKSYKRQLEKSSVSSDESDSRVAVLESKIEVLEKALKSALEKQ